MLPGKLSCGCVAKSTISAALGRLTPDAQAQYDTLIAEWLSRGRALPPGENTELSVNELVLAYFRQHVEQHYCKNGRPTSEQHCIKAALRFLKDTYGLKGVSNFGPMALKVVRQRMVDAKLCRRVVNKQVARVAVWRLRLQISATRLIEPLYYDCRRRAYRIIGSP